MLFPNSVTSSEGNVFCADELVFANEGPGSHRHSSNQRKGTRRVTQRVGSAAEG